MVNALEDKKKQELLTPFDWIMSPNSTFHRLLVPLLHFLLYSFLNELSFNLSFFYFFKGPSEAERIPSSTTSH